MNTAHSAQTNLTSGNLLEHSRLFREFQAEREEILRHKWLESEKARRDIGFENALINWIINHRAQWKQTRSLKLQHSD